VRTYAPFQLTHSCRRNVRCHAHGQAAPAPILATRDTGQAACHKHPVHHCLHGALLHPCSRALNPILQPWPVHAHCWPHVEPLLKHHRAQQRAQEARSAASSPASDVNCNDGTCQGTWVLQEQPKPLIFCSPLARHFLLHEQSEALC
jgi:hypothetical protein